MGVSFISSKQACANAEEEIPDFNFDRVHKENRAQWNDLLGRIQVDTTGVPKETVQLFYSSVSALELILQKGFLTDAFLSYTEPIYLQQIVSFSPMMFICFSVKSSSSFFLDTGENPKWNSTEPYFDSLYCNWDTYRTLYPLMSLHDPVTFANIVRGMVDIQKNEGEISWHYHSQTTDYPLLQGGCLNAEEPQRSILFKGVAVRSSYACHISYSILIFHPVIQMPTQFLENSSSSEHPLSLVSIFRSHHST